MTAPAIRRGGADDIDRVAGLIAEAFLDLDVPVWLVPDAERRARILPANYRLYLEPALTHGEIQLTEDGDTVAVWFDLTEPLPLAPGYDARLAAAVGEYVDRFRTLDRLFEAHHPQAFPHAYLAFLATRPGRQGCGLGSILMRRQHDKLDRAGLPAYVEANNARARAFYDRHGYRDLGTPFHLPDGPTVWPMWREPAS